MKEFARRTPGRMSQPGCDILYLIGQLGAGGSERQLWFLLRNLVQTGYRPAVFVWNGRRDDIYKERLEKIGIPVFGYETAGSALTRLTTCLRVARDLRPSIVHSYSFYTNIAAFLCGRILHVPAVGSIRGDFDRTLGASGPILRRLSAGWPDHQIVNSRRALEAALNTKGIFRTRSIRLVRNGIDLDAFEIVNRSDANFSDDESKGEVVILGVGSLLPVKRWDRLIAAASILRKRGLQFQVIIAGEGPARSRLEKMIEEEGLHHIVRLVGFVEDISRLMRGASFLVHPSESEGCPNVILEAMASALPVVAMDVGDINDLIEEGGSGFVVPNGDQELLIESIFKLANDSELRERMGKSARERVLQEFSLERMVHDTLAVYRRSGWKPISAGAVDWKKSTSRPLERSV